MVITTTDIQLFQILKQRIGEKEAESLVAFVDAKIKESNDANLKILTTKEDLLKLQVDIEKRFNQQIIWIVATGIALASLVIAVAKFHV
jgi:hypothetical protein